MQRKSKKKLKKHERKNISVLAIKEEKAMQELQSRNYVVKTSADKGGVAVILDNENYIKESKRQCNNKETTT